MFSWDFGKDLIMMAELRMENKLNLGRKRKI